jgi:hypothetical protein
LFNIAYRVYGSISGTIESSLLVYGHAECQTPMCLTAWSSKITKHSPRSAKKGTALLIHKPWLNDVR